MSTTCPNGHDSEWADWCSVCGERLGPVEADAAGTGSSPAAAQAASPAPEPGKAPATPVTPASGSTCGNCGEPRHEDDVFCESCGYDFASGSLPEGSIDPAGDDAGSVAGAMHVRVTVDPDFFAASVGDVDLTLPDPMPEQKVVPLAGVRILIGRTSQSRGIFPEIDVRALTEDPAVSSRHAMLERDANDAWTLTDLGSTNGTFLTTAADPAIDPGVALPVQAGSFFYLGAWTRIELAETAG